MFNINNIRTIFRREIRSYFNSPMAYIFMVLFLLFLGWFFTSRLFLVNISTLRIFFELVPIILLIFAPLVTMRLIAEERKAGTLEILMTKPIAEHEIILGKFFAAWFLYFITLVPTISYYITISLLGEIDIGPVIGGYIGLLLLGGVYFSIGLFTSTLTENQLVAAFVSFFILVAFFLLDKEIFFVSGAFLSSVFEYLSFDHHFSNIARGVIDTRDLIYYFSTIGFMLLVSTVSLQHRRI